MKNASVILSHLVNQPQFRMLKQQECYRKFTTLLGKHLQNAIAFVYVKNRTLFVAVKHPGFKMELNYNRDLLKSLLMQLNTHDTSCEMLIATKVVIFHSKYHAMPEEKASYVSVPHYIEQANGAFNTPEDEALKESFERIKALIQCKQ